MRTLLFTLFLVGVARADGPCPAGTLLLADLDAERLHLCRDGRADADYPISFGRGGRGKRRAGDLRTPVGEFTLGRPRRSREFHTFIPIGYPTPRQRRDGYTGADVGVHGPKRGLRWLGRLADLSNWTRGCIAVSRVEDIEAIARWVSAHRATRISVVARSR